MRTPEMHMPMDPMPMPMDPMPMPADPTSMPAHSPTMPADRAKVPWSHAIWARIDETVGYEMRQLQVAARFLPRVGPYPRALTRDSDRPLLDRPGLSIDEAATVPLIETWVEFALTPQQVEREETSMAGCTLAGRAANVLAQAQDLILFQGDRALERDPLFTERRVRYRSGPAGTGLVGAVPEGDRASVVAVESLRKGDELFAQRTYNAVTEGVARLQSREHYGAYAVILQTVPYADAHAPLAVTLGRPAGPIEAAASAGFYGTGTLPPLSGLLISLGGNTVDLVVGREATTSFMQQDPEGKYCFRVWNRFALRLKDTTAFIRFEFETG